MLSRDAIKTCESLRYSGYSDSNSALSPGSTRRRRPTPAKERRRKRTWWCRLFSFPRDFCAFWNATRGDAESRESVVVLAASIVIDFSYKKKWVLMRR